MVTIRFTEMEIQEIKSWGNTYKTLQEETGVKWDEQQQRILDKLKKRRKIE